MRTSACLHAPGPSPPQMGFAGPQREDRKLKQAPPHGAWWRGTIPPLAQLAPAVLLQPRCSWLPQLQGLTAACPAEPKCHFWKVVFRSAPAFPTAWGYFIPWACGCCCCLHETGPCQPILHHLVLLQPCNDHPTPRLQRTPSLWLFFITE